MTPEEMVSRVLYRDGLMLVIDKTYWAVVEGSPATDAGVIEFPLGRLDDTLGWWMKHDPTGQPAVTKWRVMGRADNISWLALEPVTGRTHQLRVHCAEMGWPILGDAIYGTAPRHGGPPMHLHAREIVVPLYKNRAPIRVIAPVPEHIRAALAACGWKGEETSQHSSFREPSEAREPGFHNHHAS